MSSSELDSFVLKFKSLWYAGIDAHLDVDTHAGQAWVGLRVGLGHPPGPLHRQPPLLKKKDSPSRQRRRARRLEAKQLAAAEAVKAAKPKDAGEEIPVRDTVEVSDKLAVEETAKNTENSELIDEFCRNTEYLDGENSSENKGKIKFAFTSIYAEEDIKEALEEIFCDKETVKSAMLLSWVRREQRSNVHDCVLVLEVAAPNTFVWPVLEGVDVDVFKEIKKIR